MEILYVYDYTYTTIHIIGTCSTGLNSTGIHITDPGNRCRTYTICIQVPTLYVIINIVIIYYLAPICL